jgi:ribosomal protein L11 methyltransferase
VTRQRWLVVTVRVPSEELVAELAEGLVALGGSAVQESGDRLTTYLEEPADVDAFKRALRERVGEVAGAGADVEWRWQDDEDWSRRWREGLAPRRIGRRLVVTQPWNRVDAAGEGSRPDDIVIVIDPATAFGTGEHATTRGALRLMETVLEGGERVLDVGTGSGILAMAAAGLGAAEVLAVESDPDAMGNAGENLERSPWRDRIELVNAEVDDHYLARHGGAGFGLIVANVLSGVLIPLLPAFARAVTSSGRIVLGGILETEAESVLDAASAAGLTLVDEDREEGWWTALLAPSPG